MLDSKERNILAGCDILIAAPGQLYDYLSCERIVHAFRRLGDTLVLDEAD
jgi:ATP-dependent RNA helicase MSS116